MARLGSKRVWKQWAESAGASAGELPALGSEAMGWDEMPQVGSSFHWSLIEDRVGEEDLGDLEALFGPEDAALLHPLNVEGDDSPDGGADGTVHYY